MKIENNGSDLNNYCYKFLNADDYSVTLDTVYHSDIGAFLICIQGEIQIFVDTKEYTMKQNSVLTLLPGSIVKIDSCSYDFTGHLIIFPSSLACGSYLKENLLYFVVQIKERPILPVSEDRMNLVSEYITLIKSLFEQPGLISCPVINGIIHSFLYALYMGYSMGKEIKTGVPLKRKNVIFRDFIKLVGAHYTQERQVEFYADKLCLTPKYLSMVIKDVYGQTPSYIIDQAVILAAKAKLQTGQYTVQQVADSLGFNNASFFGTFFKKYVGCSPGKYISDCKNR